MPKVIQQTPILVTFDDVINEFLNTQKHGTKNTYTSYLKLFLDFSKMTGKEILESRKTDKNFEWEKKTLEFKTWLIQKGYSETYSTTCVGAVRGFFSFHRMPLRFRRQEAKKLTEATRLTEDYIFDKSDFEKMALNGNLKERYVLLVGKSLGLRASDFTALTFGIFRSLKLDSEPPISLGEITTQKERVKSYPFLDIDAVPIVKQILENNQDKPDNARIIEDTEENLSVILQNLAKKSRIEPHGKRIRFHCLRKFLIDRLSAYASESQWKQIVGKKIDEKAYVSSEMLRSIYARAMRDISISNNNGKAKKIMELEAQIETLRNVLVGLLGIDKERIEEILKQTSKDAEFPTSLTTKEIFDGLARLGKQQQEKNP
jgi:hypothetical protein